MFEFPLLVNAGGQVLSHGLPLCFMIQVGLLWQMLGNVSHGVHVNEHKVIIHFLDGWYDLNPVYKAWRRSEEQYKNKLGIITHQVKKNTTYSLYWTNSHMQVLSFCLKDMVDQHCLMLRGKEFPKLGAACWKAWSP